jgi:capsular polysaccharide transport system permease protein
MAGFSASGGPPFAVALRIQMRVLGALLMREIITRYGRDNLGFLWVFFEPMLFTLGVTAFWSAAGLAHTTSLPIVAFALTGYSSVLLWRNCANRASMAIPPNLGLLYHHNVRVLDLFISRIVLEIAGATVSFVVLGSMWVFLGWMEVPADPIAVFQGWFYLCWFGGALGMVVGALSAYSDVIERLWHTIAYLMFPLSGAAFMVEWLPKNFQDFILWFPMVHGVELLREGFFGDVIRTHYDLPYVSVVCLCLTLIGLFLVRDAGSRVEVA